MQLGTTAIGIKTKEGVFLGVEKRLASTLLEPSRYFVHETIGVYYG